MDEKVTKYIDKQKSPQKEICKKLRKIVLKTFPSIQEGMKWGVPSFDDGKLYFVALKNHVNFGFLTKGFSKKELSTFKGDSNKMTRHIEIKSLDEIKEKELIKLIKLINKKQCK